jgi:hypothetical protein
MNLKKLSPLLLGVVLVLLAIAPARAELNLFPFGDDAIVEEMKVFFEGITDEMDAKLEDFPDWEAGQQAEYQFELSGIPDMPGKSISFPIILTVADSEEHAGRTYHWLEICVKDADFTSSGKPETYNLGLLIKELTDEEEQELEDRHMELQGDPEAGIKLLADLVLKVRFQIGSQPGYSLNLEEVWPLIQDRIPLLMGLAEEGGPPDDKLKGIEFHGDGGVKDIATPAGNFDSYWLKVAFTADIPEKDAALDWATNLFYTDEIPIMPLALIKFNMTADGLPELKDPMRFSLEVQNSRMSGGKSGFTNVDEFVDFTPIVTQQISALPLEGK